MITPFATFKAKFGLAFVLTEKENAWSFQPLSFILKARERAWVLLKMVLWMFKIALRLSGRHVFYVAITENVECFHYSNIETNFLKNENLFPKNCIILF